MLKKLCGSSKRIALCVILCLITLISVMTPATIKAEISYDSEPTFDAEKNTEYEITGYGNGSFTDGVLTVAKLNNAYFTTELSKNAEYYMTMTVQTDSFVNVGFKTNDGYLHLQNAGYSLNAADVSWKNKNFGTLPTGMRVTLHVMNTKVAAWVDGSKLLEETLVKNGDVRPGITWSFDGVLTVKNIKIWTDEASDSSEPAFDAEKHTEHEITDFGNGTFADGTLTVPAGTKANFTTDLAKDAEYYMTMTVKTNSSLNVGYKTNDGYLNLENIGYSLTAAGISWQNKSFGTLPTGMRVTLYVEKTKISAWIDGKKLLEADLVRNGDVQPGIAWTFSGIVTATKIKIWTEKSSSEEEPIVSDEPVFNEKTDEKISVTNYSNNSFTVSKLASGYFETNLIASDSYYMTMTVQAQDNINIGYRYKNGFINMNSHGFKSVGSGGEWVNKEFPKLLNGMRITIFSSKDVVRIWADGEKIVDAANVAGGSAFPGIYWSFNKEVQVSDLCIWQTQDLIVSNDEPEFDPDVNIEYRVKEYTGMQGENGNVTVTPLSNCFFKTDLTASSEYYMTFTVQTLNSVNIGYRTGNGYINMNSYGYKSVGSAGEWINKDFPKLAKGMRITLYSSQDIIRVWADGEKIIDATHVTGGTALPGIYWSFDSDVTLSNITIWADTAVNTDEPVFNEETDENVEVYSSNGGIYKDGTLIVEPLSSAVLDTDLRYNDDYYYSFTVKSSDSVNLGYRYSSGFLNLQKKGYSSTGTNGAWTDKEFPLLSYGVRVTVHSAKDYICVWINGEKTVDDPFYKEAEAAPGIYWSFNDTVTCTDIRVWRKKTIDSTYYGETDDNIPTIKSNNIIKIPDAEDASSNIKSDDTVGKIYTKPKTENTDASVYVKEIENEKKTNTFMVTAPILIGVLTVIFAGLAILFFVKKLKQHK